MPSIEVLIAFTFAAMLMNQSSGPSNFYVMARSISQGFSGGLAAAMGLAVGSLFYVVATALGLSVVFKHSPTVYLVVKLMGAAYLLYLGYQYIKPHQSVTTDTLSSPERKSLRSVFLQSVLVEITNPKTALFFVAFLPQFVNESSSVAPQLLVLGIIVTLTAIPCDLVVAAGSSKLSKWFTGNPSIQRVQEWVSGSILAGIGGYIALDEMKNALKNQISE